MLALIFLLVFGSAVAFLALQNTSHVSISVLTYTFPDVPLFSVIIVSVLTGAFMVYIIHIINSISTSFTIHGKNKKIKQTEKNLVELTKQIHQLQLENQALKEGTSASLADDKTL